MADRQRLERLAAEVMELSRGAVVLNLRYLDAALFRLRPEPADTTLATDGRTLFYGPEHVLRRYMAGRDLPARDLLHALMHCVFRHPFIDTLVDRERWDLAADIAMESLINSLELERFAHPRQAEQALVARALSHRLGLLTAEKLYRYFEENPAPEEWKALFRADDHVLWHKPRRQGDLDETGAGEEGEEDRQDQSAGKRQPPHEDAKREKEKKPGQRETGESGESREMPPAAQAQPSQPVKGEDSDAFSAQRGEASEAEETQRALRSEAGGESGATHGSKREDGASDQQNVGEGLDTEGGDDATPVGSQSRNDATSGGLDSPSASGTSGDSGDARSQSDASDSGGSGSGLSDAAVLEGGEAPGPADLRDYEELTRDTERHRLEQEWREVSERVQLELEAQSHQRGELPGGLMRQLRAENRTKYDYDAFLRKFAVLGEHMQLNDDEFDQVFYTYGLRLYGNLPLIEPQETKEVRRVRDFVIAIDTSGSTSGKLVERFLTRTYDILESEQSFFRKINLHVVQCDSQVQEHVKLTSQEAFRRYIEGFSAKGLGGTDFRPVFQLVDELRAAREFDSLRGLIYFTDGQGTFPERKPDYETAFVFVQDPDAPEPQVPPWAMRLVLEDEETGFREQGTGSAGPARRFQ